MRRIALLCIALTLASQTARAQQIIGTVTDSASRQPIPGAVLQLLDSAGRTLGRNITNATGQYRIALTPPMRRLRVVRIGFRPREVAIPALTNGIARVDVVMTSIPTMLEAVRVTSGANCPRRDDRAAALSLLEQARAGLLATIVAREVKPPAMSRLNFTRVFDKGGSDRIERQLVRIDSTASTRTSYQAVRSAADFVKLGFAVEKDGGVTFLGPDAETLLDDSFRDGYCFHLQRPDRDRKNQVGLAFVPATSKRERVDVNGTLWIDTVARVLKDIRYDYVGLRSGPADVHPGGRIEFRELANGVVLIDRWGFRLPALATDTIWPRTSGPMTLHEYFYAQETGGEVASAKWPDGFTWHAALGTLRLRTIDKDSMPVKAVVLRLDETDYIASPNASGILEIPNLLPGPYTGIVIDSTLATIGLTIPTGLHVVAERDRVIEQPFIVPTARDFVRAGCMDIFHEADDKGLWVIGRVYRPDGSARPDAPWSVAHLDMHRVVLPKPTRTNSGTTGSDGVFYVCSGFASGHEAVVVSRNPDRKTWSTGRATITGPVTAVRVIPQNP